VRFWLQLPSSEQHGHKGQQPEQRIVTDFLEQGINGKPKEEI
jgi:hypothetical protein